MRGIELKHIGVHSFMLKGLTARWGIDGNRPPIPPALRTALVCWYNTEIQRVTNFDVVESYAEDFTSNKWKANRNRAVVDVTAKGFHLTKALAAENFLETGAKKYAPEMVVKVSGVQPGVTRIAYRYGSYTDRVQITQDGIYTLPAGIPGAGIDGFNGFAAMGAFGECDLTIEQLPTSKLTDLSGNGHHLHLYGFTGSDNIVDGMLQHTGTQYGVSYGQPILTDYTVCSTREWSDETGDRGLASKRDTAGGGAFVLDKSSTSGAKSAYSFLAFTPITFAPAGFAYQSKTNYNGSTVITAGTGVDKPVLTVGGGLIDAGTGAVSELFKGGYKSFVLFNRTLTTEELAYVERWMA